MANTDGESAAGSLALLLDVSQGEGPLPPSEWQKGHVITPAMHGAIDTFLEHTVARGRRTLPPAVRSGGDLRVFTHAGQI